MTDSLAVRAQRRTSVRAAAQRRTSVPAAAPRRTPVLAAALLVVALAGCADMSGIGSRATLRDASSLGIASNSAAAVPSLDSQWWRAFGDTQLNTLIDQAVAGNPNLQVAQARLARAQASADIAGAALKPKVNGELDLNRQKFNSNYIYPAPLGGSTQNIGLLQLSASWELDFFGKNRSALDTAIGAANAAAADADAARVLLASNVARSYFQWARLNDQLTVARRTLAQRDETLKLVRDRVSAGLDTRLELRQSEGGLPEARQQIEALNEQIALQQHALDALVAQPNVSQSIQPPLLANVKPMALETNIPADLLGRRADIAAARWRVEAATSDVKNAKTLFYPNVNLTAFAGFQSLGFGKLLKSGSEQWGVGPAISDRHRRRARRGRPGCERPVDHAPAGRAARRADRGRRRLRHRRAALPRGPGQLPQRADRGDLRAGAAPVGRRPRRPRARHASGPGARAGRRLAAAGRHHRNRIRQRQRQHHRRAELTRAGSTISSSERTSS
jgi:NodT family efflux transporter outer membrane factor (OMF) lipoprotein